jgi:hypothetical protein
VSVTWKIRVPDPASWLTVQVALLPVWPAISAIQLVPT